MDKRRIKKTYKGKYKLNDKYQNIKSKKSCTNINIDANFDDYITNNEIINEMEDKKDLNKNFSSLMIDSRVLQNGPDFVPKIITAIQSLQSFTIKNEDEKEQKQQIFERRTIRWEDVESKCKKSKKISIQSNKRNDVRIDETKEEQKMMFIEEMSKQYDRIICLSYEAITDAWRDKGWLAGVAAMMEVGPNIPWYTYYKHQDYVEVSKNKEVNILNKKFNDKLAEIKQFEESVSPKWKTLEQQEQKLNSHNFELERIADLHNMSRVIMVIGPTGFGKSLVSNRLLGNKQDIGDIVESKQCEFKVGQTADAESVTDKLTTKSKIVHMKYGDEEESFILSVVDTPGAFDSDGNDDDYNNMMTHYFKASGGINMFAIFFKFEGKLTDKYKELIKQYAKFFGSGIWKHCCIVITHCDMDSEKRKMRVDKGMKKLREQISAFLKEISNGLCGDIPMYTFGEDNFEESTYNLCSSLLDRRNTFYRKYKCENTESPIDLLCNDLKKDVEKHNEMLKELQSIHDDIKSKKK